MNKFKSQFLFITGIVLISFGVILLSCNKTHVQDFNKNATKGEINTEKSETVFNRVKAFTETLENYRSKPGLKSGGSMQVDSALLYIVAALNYNYSFPWYAKRRIEVLESVHDTVIASTESVLTEQRIAQLYYELEGQLRLSYNSSAFNEKKLLNIDLSFYDNGQGGIKIKSKAILTSVEPDPPEEWEPPYEDWKYGYGNGYCNDNMPPSNDDAGIVLTYEVNNTLNPGNNTQKWYCFNLTEVVFPYYNYPNTYSQTTDNYTDYNIFFASNTDGLTIGTDEECLYGVEMSWYKNHTVAIFNDYLDSHSGSSFEECFIEGFKTVGANNELISIEHITKAEFSYRIIRPAGDEPTDIS
ncbi:MAG: hypothetical protein GXO89_14560 [Chlorobi bacterium]|nr:hypothetical protein [Chlorobiota bacterium]